MSKFYYTAPDGEQFELSKEQLAQFKNSPNFDVANLEIDNSDQAEQVENSTAFREEDKKWLRENDYDLAGWRALNSDIDQDEVAAVQEAQYKTDNPNISAIWPQSAAADARGEIPNLGETLHDVVPGVGRVGMAGASALGTVLGGDQRGAGEAFMDQLGRTEAAGDVEIGDSGLANFVEGVGEFGEDMLLDPITYMPFGKAMQGIKAGAKAVHGGSGLIKGAKAGSDAFRGVAPVATEAAAKVIPRVVDPAANTIGGSLGQSGARMADDIPKVIKGIGPAPKSAFVPEPILTQGQKVKQGIQSGGMKYGTEGALEAGAEAGLNEDATLGSIMTAGFAPAALAGVGRGLQKGAMDLYAGRLKLNKSDMGKRFSPKDTEPLFKDNMVPSVPLTGGEVRMFNNMENELRGTNIRRAGGADAAEAGYKQGSAVIDQLNPETGVKRTTPLTGMNLFDAEKQIERNTIPIQTMFNDARLKLAREVAVGKKLDVDTGNKVLDFINREEEKMLAGFSVPQQPWSMDFMSAPQDLSDKVLPRDVANWGSRMFDNGNVNRRLNIEDPSRPAAIGSEMLWENSRQFLDEMPEYAATSAEYRKWLPLRDAVENKLQTVGTNRSMLELASPGSAGPLELLRMPSTTKNMYDTGRFITPSYSPDVYQHTQDRIKMQAINDAMANNEDE